MRSGKRSLRSKVIPSFQDRWLLIPALASNSLLDLLRLVPSLWLGMPANGGFVASNEFV
ncbi:MAG: hypothetical protein HC769_21990 [Cyanobacteria bacterium CRU_2_1]|nr:hypothetical protein [Cyanobacteria bacterium RU_5_0]NJR61264.1 hypothetical protein [Cyanobacteria bacterium CRU_2_1]